MKKIESLHGFSVLIIATVVCVYFLSMAAVARTAMFRSQSGIIYRGNQDGVSLACKVPWNASSLGDVMKTADDAGVSITFFVTADWIKQNPSALNSIGGLHRFAILGKARTEKELKAEIDEMSALGLVSHLYMPNDDEDADKLLPAAKKCGVEIVLSSLDILGHSTDASDAANRVSKAWFNGAIIRFEPTKTIAQALPEIIAQLHDAGANVIDLNEMIQIKDV